MSETDTTNWKPMEPREALATLAQYALLLTGDYYKATLPRLHATLAKLISENEGHRKVLTDICTTVDPAADPGENKPEDILAAIRAGAQAMVDLVSTRNLVEFRKTSSLNALREVAIERSDLKKDLEETVDAALLNRHLLLLARREIGTLREALETTACRCKLQWEDQCPTCGGKLQEVRYRGGALNEEQFNSIRAGDYYCENCKGTEAATGFKYWWKRDLQSSIKPCGRCAALAGSINA